MKAVNLLPNDQRASAVKVSAPAGATPSGGSAFGAWMLLGFLALAVAASAAYVLMGNAVKDRESELARVTREAEATKAKADELQAFADFKTVAEGRVQTVRALAGSRFDWEMALRDLSRALPADVHLSSVSGSTGTQAAASTAGTAAAIQAPSIALQGCATDQGSVARLMSRLKMVRGVTRVSLAKSDKDGGGATAATAATGDGAQLCPKGSPPAFDISVYFERAAVAANAAPNLGAAPPAGEAAPNGSTTAPNAAATPGASGQTSGSTGTTPQPATGTTGATQGVSTK